MATTYIGMNEGAINARLEYAAKVRGAKMLAYPPVVAGGDRLYFKHTQIIYCKMIFEFRANTLHYVSNNQNVEDGSLVLVDAGAHYHGYVCDITRTWPISGQ